ncbi:MAG: hypothetical protein KGY80_11945 [Candidatus Thorarchaeota archaeon]|nr:hypothetical protein [Candidatus Thorarchaeota archaeon]
MLIDNSNLLEEYGAFLHHKYNQIFCVDTALARYAWFNVILGIVSRVLFLLPNVNSRVLLILFLPSLVASLVTGYKVQEELPIAAGFFMGKIRMLKVTLLLVVLGTLALFFIAIYNEIVSFLIWNTYAIGSIVLAEYIGSHFESDTQDRSAIHYPEQAEVKQQFCQSLSSSISSPLMKTFSTSL